MDSNKGALIVAQYLAAQGINPVRFGSRLFKALEEVKREGLGSEEGEALVPQKLVGDEEEEYITKSELLSLMKAEEGDRRMIFGKPFEYRSGKWEPAEGGPEGGETEAPTEDIAPAEGPDEGEAEELLDQMSPEEALDYLETGELEEGPELEEGDARAAIELADVEDPDQAYEDLQAAGYSDADIANMDPADIPAAAAGPDVTGEPGDAGPQFGELSGNEALDQAQQGPYADVSADQANSAIEEAGGEAAARNMLQEEGIDATDLTEAEMAQVLLDQGMVSDVAPEGGVSEQDRADYIREHEDDLRQDAAQQLFDTGEFESEDDAMDAARDLDTEDLDDMLGDQITEELQRGMPAEEAPADEAGAVDYIVDSTGMDDAEAETVRDYLTSVEDHTDDTLQDLSAEELQAARDRMNETLDEAGDEQFVMDPDERDNLETDLYTERADDLDEDDLDEFSQFLNDATDAEIRDFQEGTADPVEAFEQFMGRGSEPEGADVDSPAAADIDIMAYGYSEDQAQSMLEEAKADGYTEEDINSMNNEEFENFLDTYGPTEEGETEAPEAAGEADVAEDMLMDTFPGASVDEVRNALSGLDEEELAQVADGDFSPLDETFLNRMDAEGKTEEPELPVEAPEAEGDSLEQQAFQRATSDPKIQEQYENARGMADDATDEELRAGYEQTRRAFEGSPDSAFTAGRFAAYAEEMEQRGIEPEAETVQTLDQQLSQDVELNQQAADQLESEQAQRYYDNFSNIAERMSDDQLRSKYEQARRSFEENPDEFTAAEFAAYYEEADDRATNP